jgi:hypothetical protein
MAHHDINNLLRLSKPKSFVNSRIRILGSKGHSSDRVSNAGRKHLGGYFATA